METIKNGIFIYKEEIDNFALIDVLKTKKACKEKVATMAIHGMIDGEVIIANLLVSQVKPHIGKGAITPKDCGAWCQDRYYVSETKFDKIK